MKKITLLPSTIFIFVNMIIFLNPITLHSKRKPNTTATPSAATPSAADRVKVGGLEYEVLIQPNSDAKTPIKSQSVCVHYTGWLNNNGQLGKKFDSSVDRNEPFNFVLGVGQVIEGWDKMVALMKVGQKVRVYIPAALAYGTRGHGSIIPKSADLIFDIELLKIN